MRQQAGFISGVVIEINISLAVLAVAAAILVSLTSFHLKPRPLDTKESEPVAAAAASQALPSAPAGWTVTPGQDGVTVIRREERGWRPLAVLGLLLPTVVLAFVFPLRLPYWLLLAATCGLWWYGATSPSFEQRITISPDGTVELARRAPFLGFVPYMEKLAVKDIDSVRVHRARAEAYLAYRKDDRLVGWVLRADSPEHARAAALLVQSRLTRPVAQPARRP